MFSKEFWRIRLTMIGVGVCLGLLAQQIIGQPEPEGVPEPAFHREISGDLPEFRWSPDK